MDELTPRGCHGMIRQLGITKYTSSQHWHHKNIATWANYHTTSAVLYEATLYEARQQSVPARQPVPLIHYFQNQLKTLSPAFAAGAVIENNSHL